MLVLDLRFPGFLVLAVIGFIMGLVRSQRLHFLFWFLPTSMVIQSLLGGYTEFRNVGFLGAIGVGLCWLVGWLIRGREYALANSVATRWLRFAIRGVVVSVSVLLAGYGWFVLHDTESTIPPMILLNSSAVIFVMLPSIPVFILVYDVYRKRIHGEC